MKPKKIALYAEQGEACKEFFDKAAKAADSGHLGAVIGQIVRTNGGEYCMLVSFADEKTMLAVAEAQGRESAILEWVPE